MTGNLGSPHDRRGLQGVIEKNVDFIYLKKAVGLINEEVKIATYQSISIGNMTCRTSQPHAVGYLPHQINYKTDCKLQIRCCYQLSTS